MLNVMRENLRHLKWVLVLVAVSMVGYLGYDCRRGGAAGPSGPWAARVNGDAIAEQRFIRTARLIDQRYRQLFGDGYPDIQKQLRVGSVAVQALIDDELVLQDARRLGLAVSKEDVARAIREDPGFHDANGQFVGIERYTSAVTRFAGSVGAYEDEVRRQLLLEQWTDLVTQSVSVDEADLERAHRERTVKTAVDYVVVASADQKVDRDASEAQLRAWYADHPQDYRRPESRRTRYVVVSRDAQKAKVAVTDEEISASYSANQARYSHPEQRSARHILFRIEPGADEAQVEQTRAEAEGVLERIRGGEDFATLARSLSQDPVSAARGGDLGWFGRGDMVQPFEAAVFDTPPGQLAPLTRTDFGFHIIEVTGSREAGVTPLADVKEEVRRELEARRAQDLVVAEAQRLRSELTSPDQLAALAQREGLEVHERLIAADDRLTDLGAAPDFGTTVAGLAAGGISPPLRVADGLAIVVVDEVLPPALAPFDDVKGRVATDLINDRAHHAALASARKALAGAGDLGAVAERLALEVKSSGDLSPGQSLPAIGGSSPELQQALFGDAAAVGDRAVLDVPAGALVYEIKRKDGFDRLAFEMAKADLRQELLRQRRDQYRQSVLDRLRPAAQIEVNDELIRRIDG